MLFLVVSSLLTSAVSQSAAERWRPHEEQLEVLELWQRSSREHRPSPFAVEHVSVVDVTAGKLVADQTVRVRGRTIEWVGPASEAHLAEDERRIDGRGKFLMPGLVDMHVHHLTSCSHPLLELACGVTTARDMCGFPWLLEWREQIRAGELLAPDLFVAGHILNAAPMEMYATVVRTPEEAREAVALQVEAGYDFIKTHNNLPLAVYRAICAEARLAGVPVVGHVPQSVPLAEAFAQGQATLEHFKGYILDASLTLTDEEYVEATRKARAVNCPTLSTFRIGLSGQGAEEFIAEFPGMRYVSIFDRRQWLAEASAGGPPDSHARVHELSRKIFADLLAVNARFVTGTDSGGGYRHMIPGFALWDEMEQMESLGLPTAEVLRAATIHAAEALGQKGQQGEVVRGQRANLLLLDADPLQGVKNVQRVAGVSVRGTWLDRDALDEMLASIEGIMSHGGASEPPPAPAGEDLTRFVERMEALRAQGQVFMVHQIENLAELAQASDRDELGVRLSALNGR